MVFSKFEVALFTVRVLVCERITCMIVKHTIPRLARSSEGIERMYCLIYSAVLFGTWK